MKATVLGPFLVNGNVELTLQVPITIDGKAVTHEQFVSVPFQSIQHLSKTEQVDCLLNTAKSHLRAHNIVQVPLDNQDTIDQLQFPKVVDV